MKTRNGSNVFTRFVAVSYSPKPFRQGETSLAAAVDSPPESMNFLPAEISLAVASRPSTMRYSRCTRLAGSVSAATSGLFARCSACSAINELFNRNNACCGTVVV